MIDSTKLSTDWGYGNLYGYKSPTQQKTSVTETPSGYMGPTSPGTVAQTTPTGGFNYPGAWGGLQDYYTKLMSGGWTNPAYQAGMDWTKMMTETGGSPVDIEGWANAYRPAMLDEYSNAVKQMAEQAGVGGTRYGSGLQQSIGQYGGQLYNQFNKEMMSNWLQAQEAAKQRAYGAGQSYLPYAQLGLGSEQYGAGGLLGLGQAQGDYFTQAMQNLLSGGQYANQMSIDPATQLMAGLIGQPGYAQQTWQPSTITNLLGVLGSMPWSQIFSGGGAGGSSGGGLSTIPGASIW